MGGVRTVAETRAVQSKPAPTQRRRLFWQNFGYAWFAVVLLIVLLGINLLLDPKRFAFSNLGTTLGLTAPLILAAIASVPPILAGGGGIDLSVGPFMGLMNALIVQELLTNQGITSPLVIVPAAVASGIASGAVNGALAASLRLQPIVATLGTYLVYSGLTLWLVPTPTGSVPNWLINLSGTTSVLPIIGVLIVWYGVTKLPYYDYLMATGSDDRAAYASGVPVMRVRLGAYVLAGIFAAVAGISLTGLLGSVDPNVGPTYTLTAIAAVALGGVSLGGGRGGMLGALVGAIDIFLIQNILTYFNTSSFTLQAAYGAILVGAVMLNAAAGRVWRRVRLAAW